MVYLREAWNLLNYKWNIFIIVLLDDVDGYSCNTTQKNAKRYEWRISGYGDESQINILECSRS